MDTFVGAEYIIANMLIANKKQYNKDEISLEELNNAGVYIQRMSLAENVDAIFLSSSEQIASAMFDFSDYFEYNSKRQMIRVTKTKKIEDLESRFIGFLPFAVLSFLVKTANEFVSSEIA